MKNLIFLLSISFFTLTFLSCSSNRSANQAMNDSTIELIDLTDRIKKVRGVITRGTGRTATFRMPSIGGRSFINQDMTPIFDLDGRVFKDYTAVYDMVELKKIKTIRVIKSGADLGMYGSRGANGVIKIEYKKEKS